MDQAMYRNGTAASASRHPRCSLGPRNSAEPAASPAPMTIPGHPSQAGSVVAWIIPMPISADQMPVNLGPSWYVSPCLDGRRPSRRPG